MMKLIEAMRKIIRPIHIAGANGFPVCLYGPFMEELSNAVHSRATSVPLSSTRSNIQGTDVFGHIRQYPDWTGMVDHLVDSIQSRHAAPVIAIGHSLGGALMGCAASKRPDLFHKLILIDCPYFSLPKRMLWALGLYFPEDVVRKVHPIIKMAAKKPKHWATKIEAQNYFKGKKMFQKFDPNVQSIFLNECLVEKSGGWTELLFPVEDECAVYLKVPCELKFHPAKYFGQHDFPHKAVFFYTKDYHIIDAIDIHWMKFFDNQNITFREYRGSHFWPLEQPSQCVALIAEHIFKEDVDVFVNS